VIHIDWAALAKVAAVSIAASVIFVVLLAGGVRFVSSAKVRSRQGGSGGAILTLGYGCIGLAGVLVLYGIWLIVPQLH
jgi:hypothetical protein